MSQEQNDRRGDYRILALASMAVGELVAPILLGIWIDNRYGSNPWGLVVGAVIGIVGGIGHLLVVANRMNKNNPSK